MSPAKRILRAASALLERVHGEPVTFRGAPFQWIINTPADSPENENLWKLCDAVLFIPIYQLDSPPKLNERLTCTDTGDVYWLTSVQAGEFDYICRMERKQHNA